MVDYQTESDVTAEVTDPKLANIREEWFWVEEGIKEILNEQPQLTFRAEDVYAQCVNGDALLWVAPEGFVVSSDVRDEFTGKPTFVLWIAWAKEKGANCAVKYYDFFAKNAAEAGYEAIETRTPILQIEKYLMASGWRKETAIFTRDL